MYNERPLKQNAPVVGDLKDCLEHDISSQVRCWVIFWLEYLDMALGTHSRKCHIKLPMGEKVLSQVNSHRFKGLALALVASNGKTCLDWELLSLHFKRYSSILWMEKDTWNHNSLALVYTRSG